jgi:hypothetical protein
MDIKPILLPKVKEDGMIDLETVIPTEKLLKKLKSNRKTHSKIIEEAREGYLRDAQAALNKRLKKLESGKVAHLSFSLSPPVEHLDEYDTVISMLEWTTEKEIKLSPSEFRNFVMDEWGWSRSFFQKNAMYSGVAASGCAERGYN